MDTNTNSGNSMSQLIENMKKVRNVGSGYKGHIALANDCIKEVQQLEIDLKKEKQITTNLNNEMKVLMQQNLDRQLEKQTLIDLYSASFDMLEKIAKETKNWSMLDHVLVAKQRIKLQVNKDK